MKTLTQDQQNKLNFLKNLFDDAYLLHEGKQCEICFGECCIDEDAKEEEDIARFSCDNHIDNLTLDDVLNSKVEGKNVVIIGKLEIECFMPFTKIIVSPDFTSMQADSI